MKYLAKAIDLNFNNAVLKNLVQITNDGNETYISKWSIPDEQPSDLQAWYDSHKDAACIASKTDQIKLLCADKILNVLPFPEWKQRNAAIYFAKGGAHDVEPGITYDDLIAKMDELRTYSDTLESQLAVSSDPESFDITQGWPY